MKDLVSRSLNISESFSQLSEQAILTLTELPQLQRKYSIQSAVSTMYLSFSHPADAQFFRDHAFEVLSVGNTLNIKISNRSTKETKVFGIAPQMSDNHFLPDEVRDPLVQASVVAPKYAVTNTSHG